MASEKRHIEEHEKTKGVPTPEILRESIQLVLKDKLNVHTKS